MKRLVSLSLIATFAFVALSVSFPTSGNAQGAGLVSSMLNKMDGARKNLKSLRANITMEKYNAQLRDSDKYRGVVLYIPATGRNAFVKIEWQSPQHEILAVKNDQYTLFRPRLGTALIGNKNSNRNKAGGVLEMMNMSGAQLRARFDQYDAREETLWGGVKTIHLTVVPKGAASYKYAEIWVDEGGMPVQTKVVEKNDDATTVRLTNLEKNASISLDEFDLKLDSSVKKIKG